MVQRAVEKAREGVNAGGLLFPLVLVIQIAGFSFWLGILTSSIGTASDNSKAALEAVQALREDKEFARYQVRLENLEKDLAGYKQAISERLETQRRLDQDYMEGRIGHLPYRPRR